MEYVAAGEIHDGGVHMLGTGGMLEYVREHPNGDFIVATETGMLHPLRKTASSAHLTPANPKAVCKFMKTITLAKLRDSLRERKFEVRVPPEIAQRARLPIERMVAIG
jgi:quinolinate synthase